MNTRTIKLKRIFLGAAVLGLMSPIIAQQSPYGGTATELPGSLYPTNFDEGGSGIAYNDNTPQNEGGGTQRSTAVDLGSDGALGWTSAGEWLEFTVNIADKSTPYQINALVASPAGSGSFTVLVDGQPLVAVASIAKSGGWNTITEQGLGLFNLPLGEHVIRFAIQNGGFNFYGLKFNNPGFQGPFPRYEQPLVNISAYNYDSGGEGIAYHDNSPGNSGDYHVHGHRDQRSYLEDVDVVTTDGIPAIAYINAGEWLEYRVDIQNTDSPVQKVVADLSSPAGNGEFKLFIDGLEIFVSNELNSTAGWSDFQQQELGSLTFPSSLTNGTHTLRVLFTQSGFNLRKLSFEVVEDELEYETLPTYLQVNVPHVAPVGTVKEFPINVPSAGEYQINAFVTSTVGNGGFTLSLDENLLVNVSEIAVTDDRPWVTQGLGLFNLPAGNHILKFETLESNFNIGSLQIANIQQGPWPRTAKELSGVFRVFDYDFGGQGVAYNDLSPGNSGNIHPQPIGPDSRNDDDVDKAYASINGQNEAVMVSTEAGEWLEYTIQLQPYHKVLQSVSAVINSSNGQGAFKLFVDGIEIFESSVFTATGNDFEEQDLGNLNLPSSLSAPAEHILRVFITEGGFSLGNLRFEEVVSNQQPFDGRIGNIPGYKEAEHYDYGGQGVAYSDNTSGSLGDYVPGPAPGQRTLEDVDLVNVNGGGVSVGYIEAGEWLEYTVYVEETDELHFNARVASPLGEGSFKLSIDGIDVFTSQDMPQTNGWQQWADHDFGSFFIPSSISVGEHVLRLEVTSSGWNIDNFNIVDAPSQAPWDGRLNSISYLPMYEYDFGGQGVAYYDKTPGSFGDWEPFPAPGSRNLEDVDLINPPIAGAAGLGYIDEGEWLEFTVYVTQGEFLNKVLTAEYASPNGNGAFKLFLDGQEFYSSCSLPSTGNWSTYSTFECGNLSVPVFEDGEHVVRILFTEAGLNLLNVRTQAPSSAKIGTEAKYGVEIQISPNPFQGVINISSEEAINKITIVDLQGRIVDFDVVSENENAVSFIINESYGSQFIAKVQTKMGLESVVITRK